jgi:hypothetical protein
MLPIARDAIPNIREGNHFKVFLDTLRMSVPAAYVWLAIFYSFFHAHMIGGMQEIFLNTGANGISQFTIF